MPWWKHEIGLINKQAIYRSGILFYLKLKILQRYNVHILNFHPLQLFRWKGIAP